MGEARSVYFKSVSFLILMTHFSFSAQVAMQSDALLKEHEVRKRDLMILKYDKQRSLCDEIIQRQQKLIEGKAVDLLQRMQNIRDAKEAYKARSIAEKITFQPLIELVELKTYYYLASLNIVATWRSAILTLKFWFW